MKMDLNFYKSKVNTKEILKGIVQIVHFDDSLKSDVLMLDLKGVKGIVLRKDVESNEKRKLKSLTGFVGREILFTVEEVIEDKNLVICSRANAQEIMKPEIIERLSEGDTMEAQIVHFLKYGAFVEIQGITGLLKNTDFADDHTKINDIKKIGDKLRVRLARPVADNGKLNFQAIEKYKNPTILNINTFERDQVVLGVVRDIKPFGAFVNIAPGLDALCNLPPNIEIEEGLKVRFRIQQVIIEDNKVRGKILTTL